MFWHYYSQEATVVSVMHVFEIDVQLECISPTNMPTCNIIVRYRLDRCKQKKLRKIAWELHCAILEQIVRRDGLKYDDASDNRD